MLKLSLLPSEKALYALSPVGVIFDGDDTLWDTQPLYDQAKAIVSDEMVRLGYEKEEAERLLENIDVSNVRHFGFSRGRFAKSMSDTYRYLCLLYKKPVDDSVASRVEAMANTTLEGRPVVDEAAQEVLALLQARNFRLVLSTKGELELQETKILNSNLMHCFHWMFVVAEKTEWVFQRIAEECNLDMAESWSIGNSMRSDVNPALRLGMRAILIHKKSWAFEQEEPYDKTRLFEVSSLKQVPAILSEHSKAFKV